VILRCVECQSESSVGLRWRAYLAHDPCGDDPPEMAVFCPSCADREFGGFGEFGEFDGLGLE
jgi:hypothetical protein